MNRLDYSIEPMIVSNRTPSRGALPSELKDNHAEYGFNLLRSLSDTLHWAPKTPK